MAKSLIEWQKEVWSHQVEHFLKPRYPEYFANRLQNEAGELAGLLDKLWRERGLTWKLYDKCVDHKEVVNICNELLEMEDIDDDMTKELGDVAVFLLLTASQYNIDIEDALEKTLDKNTKRIKRKYFGETQKD